MPGVPSADELPRGKTRCLPERLRRVKKRTVE
jgi:hypothetical protein